MALTAHALGFSPARRAGALARGSSGPQPRSHPVLLPATRWARVALAVLLVFTLARGLLWATTTPAFWGPDEDYHFLYVEYLTTHHRLIDPKKPLYPLEYIRVSPLTLYDSYGAGPRRVFQGDPKASIRELARLPQRARDPVAVGRGVGVVHPPLYHVVGAIINAAGGHSSILTRLTWVRYLSVICGVLGVWASWLLASQLFRRDGPALLVAYLVAAQPMIGFLNGIVNHDSLLIATFTVAVALMAFILRTAPRARQGAWLGGAIALAMLTKGSALVLLPLAALTYVGQALTFRGRWREVMRSALLAAVIVLVVAGWWYVRSLLVYHSLTGIAAGGSGIGGAAQGGLGALVERAKSWSGFTYRTYWFHYVWFEAPKGSAIFYLPAYLGLTGMLGLARLVPRLRSTFAESDARLRQAILYALAALGLYIPFMYFDIRGSGSFLVSAGRFLLPAYPAVCALFVLGVRELVRPRAHALVMSSIALIATFFLWHVWTTNYAHRYYGPGSLSAVFHRMTWDHPAFVTDTSITLVFAATLISLAAVAVVVALGWWHGGKNQGCGPSRSEAPAKRYARGSHSDAPVTASQTRE